MWRNGGTKIRIRFNHSLGSTLHTRNVKTHKNDTTMWYVMASCSRSGSITNANFHFFSFRLCMTVNTKANQRSLSILWRTASSIFVIHPSDCYYFWELLWLFPLLLYFKNFSDPHGFVLFMRMKIKKFANSCRKDMPLASSECIEMRYACERFAIVKCNQFMWKLYCVSVSAIC